MYSAVESVECSQLSVESFNSLYLQPGNPVMILKGCADWAPCRWTFDSLRDRVGDQLVDVRTQTNHTEYKIGRKYGLASISVRQYIDDLLHELPISKGRYLAVQPIPRTFPALTSDVDPLPRWVGKLHSGPHLWVASRGHYEFTHYDPDDGLLMMIQGQKRVRLISPAHLHAMYPNTLGSLGRTIQSQVDLEDENLASNFPLFDRSFVLETVLNPGDCLFIPFGWWHQVTSLTASISINMFWGPKEDNGFLNCVLFTKVERWQAFQYWFRNILAQNENHENTRKWLPRTSEVLHQFLYRQFKENAEEKHLALLEHEVLNFFGLSERPARDPNDTQKYPPVLEIRGLKSRGNGALASSQAKVDKAVGKGKKVCREFRDTGLCKWGSACKFAHRQISSSAAPPIPSLMRETVSYHNVTVVLQQNLQATAPEGVDPTGLVCWDCSRVLFALLTDEKNQQRWIKNKTVLELGCGLGLLGLAAAKCHARVVVLTDLPHCLPLVHQNLRINSFLAAIPPSAHNSLPSVSVPETQVESEQKQATIHMHSQEPEYADPLIYVQKLYWGDRADLKAIGRIGVQTFDLVLLSEVFHWPGLDILEDDTRGPLLETMLTLTHSGSIVLLAYKNRDTERESAMMEMIEKHFRITPLVVPDLSFETRENGSETMIVCEMIRT